jgi:NAD(P)-dependent dehydrogenase (short-subunit alcohol dehydrogenase family)
VARIVDRMGGLDIVHLNAGVTTGESDLEQLTDERYRRLLRVNVDGVVFGARAVLPVLRQRGGGDVVATASIAGVVPMPVDPLYSMTKHAVVGLVRSLGPVYEGQNIRINAVCPGITDTPMVDRERARLEEAGFPLIQPSEIAEAVMRAVTSGVGGQCWVVQPGRAPEPYRFRGIFGPAVAGAEGMAPPL